MRTRNVWLAALVMSLAMGTVARANAKPRQRFTFEQLDKNGDGKIVASEVPALSWQRLSQADTNKDNAVTKAEFDAFRASRPGRGANWGALPPSSNWIKKWRWQDRGLGSPRLEWQRIEQADTNKDNAVTKAEFEAFSRVNGPGRGAKSGAVPPSNNWNKKMCDGKIVASEVPSWVWQRLRQAGYQQGQRRNQSGNSKLDERSGHVRAKP